MLTSNIAKCVAFLTGVNLLSASVPVTGDPFMDVVYKLISDAPVFGIALFVFWKMQEASRKDFQAFLTQLAELLKEQNEKDIELTKSLAELRDEIRKCSK